MTVLSIIPMIMLKMKIEEFNGDVEMMSEVVNPDAMQRLFLMRLLLLMMYM